MSRVSELSELEPPADRPRLSVVVPAYGEGRRIAGTIASLREALGVELVGHRAPDVVGLEDGVEVGSHPAAQVSRRRSRPRVPRDRTRPWPTSAAS